MSDHAPTEKVLPDTPASLVTALMERGVEERATDIHFSPLGDAHVVRIRVDGFLRDLQTLPADVYPRVISRIKVLADIDIAERRRPQDGRMTLSVDDRDVNFRVSCVPTLHGESVVLRVLDRAVGLRTIDELGMRGREAVLLRSLLGSPSGIVVVTGPTGSGKTTTLYAALSELSAPDRNVITIEDPVEYDLPRVLQGSVNSQIGVTFSEMLRSFLRHDPDVIMVGEIRDSNTAAVAIRAALTGHVVLTSLHTHRAVEAIAALVNFGVKPYSLAPALRGVVAQQLIRRICEHCKTRQEYGEAILDDPDFRDVLPAGTTPSFSYGLGCEHCFQTGYRGRRGVFEILQVSEEIQRQILAGAGFDAIERSAIESGMMTLRQSGFSAVLDGTTTVEEVVRAVQFE